MSYVGTIRDLSNAQKENKSKQNYIFGLICLLYAIVPSGTSNSLCAIYSQIELNSSSQFRFLRKNGSENCLLSIYYELQKASLKVDAFSPIINICMLKL